MAAIASLDGLHAAVDVPTTTTAVILLALGVLLIVTEAHLPTGGILAALGVAGLIGGVVMLFNADSDTLEVGVPAVIATTVLLAVVAVVVSRRVYVAHRDERVMTGWEELIGARGEVRSALDPVGQVFVEGALWRARAEEGEAPTETGAAVKVTRVDGLTLYVERV